MSKHADFAAFLQRHPSLLVITGAGCSAASGIPTYRDRSGSWQRSAPIEHQEFIQQEHNRKRYWARSMAGWPAVQKAQPSTAHRALATLEQRGSVSLLVTQNVDRLHQRAGHVNVVDLHGRLDRVRCLSCHATFERTEMQRWLSAINVQFDLTRASFLPDGDAEVENKLTERINVPACPNCDGILKPDVVFYGGGVDKQVVNRIYQALPSMDALLVVGSSLMVYSSFRFCRRAHELNIPIAILNEGTTRADDIATLKIAADCQAVLAGI